MNRAWRSFLLGAVTLLLAVAVQEGTAAACTYRCVEVQGPQPFCQRCVDVGYFTNEFCVNSGDCACLDAGMECFFLASASSTEALKAAIFAPEAQAIATASAASEPAAAQN